MWRKISIFYIITLFILNQNTTQRTNSMETIIKVCNTKIIIMCFAVNLKYIRWYFACCFLWVCIKIIFIWKKLPKSNMLLGSMVKSIFIRCLHVSYKYTFKIAHVLHLSQKTLKLDCLKWIVPFSHWHKRRFLSI